ncbi:hypothetical protein ATCC90586_010904 [Pythium insidiosum]|nr:hypothetical protein ATCC90586_010904 [Pythium insidiosum]
MCEADDWVIEETVSAIVKKRDEFNLDLRGRPYGTPAPFTAKSVDKWSIGHQTWPKRAIERGDLAYLKKLHALVLSDPRLAEEPEMSFEDVTVAAIASGNIDIVNWILTAVYPSQADEENLLEYAVYYGQTNVAKRLLATYPKSCQLPLAGDRFRLCSDGYCSQEILDWLDTVVTHDAHLQQHLSWPGIVDDIVAQGDADLLVFS